MKRSAVVLSILGTFGVAAQAQTAVTIYGIVDAGIVRESGGAAGSITKLTSGIAQGSRLGFRGTEDLGGGMSSIFVLESGFQIDTGTSGQGGLLFGRQAFVGLNSRVGAVTLGRQYTPHFLAVSFVDPFASGLAGTNTTVMALSGTRMNNTIKYTSPTLGGFGGEVAYGFGETAGDNSANSQYGAAISYAGGPLQVKLAHHNRNVFVPAAGAVAARDSDARNTLLAATYDFGVAKAYLGYGVNKGFDSSPLLVANPYGAAVAPAASTDSRDMTAGVSVPFGQHIVLASVIRKDDRNPANRDANKFGIGYFYLLSKRTSLYTAFSKISNKNGAPYTVGSAIEPGSGNKGFDIGVRHVF